MTAVSRPGLSLQTSVWVVRQSSSSMVVEMTVLAGTTVPLQVWQQCADTLLTHPTFN